MTSKHQPMESITVATAPRRPVVVFGHHQVVASRHHVLGSTELLSELGVPRIADIYRLLLLLVPYPAPCQPLTLHIHDDEEEGKDLGSAPASTSKSTTSSPASLSALTSATALCSGVSASSLLGRSTSRPSWSRSSSTTSPVPRQLGLCWEGGEANSYRSRIGRPSAAPCFPARLWKN